MSRTIAGIIPVVHTPFLEDDRIDFDVLSKQLAWSTDQGADGYCTGMVTELLRLTYSERMELTDELARMRPDNQLFVMSVGAESTKQAIEFARHAEQAGADAVMAIPPLSTGLSSDATLRYFIEIARSVALPVIVQDPSGYVGQAIDLSVYQELLQEFGDEKVLFKPEAAPSGPNLSRLLQLTDRRARVFEGSGGVMLVDNFRRGIVGAIPGMEFLHLVVPLWQALHAGDDDKVYQLYLPLCALVSLQLQAGLDGFLAIEKYVLHRRGIFPNQRRRRPYNWELDEATAQEVERLLAIGERALRK